MPIALFLTAMTLCTILRRLNANRINRVRRRLNAETPETLNMCRTMDPEFNQWYVTQQLAGVCFFLLAICCGSLMLVSYGV